MREANYELSQQFLKFSFEILVLGIALLRTVLESIRDSGDLVSETDNG